MKRLHAAAASIALATICAFLAATLVTELFFGGPAVAQVKRAILYGLLLLIPALATTAATGFSLARTRTDERVAAKKRRMPFIALNGLLLLVPIAFFLDAKAGAAKFDAVFYAVQSLEIALGLTQLSLMAKSFAAGRSLARGA